MLHTAVLGLLLLAARARPVDELVVPVVTVQIEESGAVGAGQDDAPSGGSAAAAEAAATPSAVLQPAPAPPETAPVKLAPPVKLTGPPKPRPQPQPRPAPSVARVTPAPPASAPALAPPPPTPIPMPSPAPTPAPATAASAEPGPQAAPAQATASAGGGAAGGGASADSASGVQSGAGAGAGGPGASVAGAGSADDYLDRVRRWITRYRQYPDDAVHRKQQGTVLVAFTILRDGSVLDPVIEHSSGFPLLDQAVLEALRTASPVPPLPPSIQGERGRVAIPFNFSLGFFQRLF